MVHPFTPAVEGEHVGNLETDRVASYGRIRSGGVHRPTLKLVTVHHIPVDCSSQTQTETTTTTFRIVLIAEAMGIYRLIRYKATPTTIRTITKFTSGIAIPQLEDRQFGTQSRIAQPLVSSAAARVNEKVDPIPGSDSTQIVPPNPSTMFLQTARPRPVPGTSLSVSRTKGMNTRSWFARAIPTPLSSTLMTQFGPRFSAPK